MPVDHGNQLGVMAEYLGIGAPLCSRATYRYPLCGLAHTSGRALE